MAEPVGGAEYKAIGNALFYTSAKKLYREWSSAEAFTGGVPVFFPATGYFAQIEFPFSERAVPVPVQE